jgi:hypothetical protein
MASDYNLTLRKTLLQIEAQRRPPSSIDVIDHHLDDCDGVIPPVPQYAYLYVNGVPVLVEPDTRRIVYIFRS